MDTLYQIQKRKKRSNDFSLEIMNDLNNNLNSPVDLKSISQKLNTSSQIQSSIFNHQKKHNTEINLPKFCPIRPNFTYIDQQTSPQKRHIINQLKNELNTIT